MSNAAVTEKSEIKALRLHGAVVCRTTSAGKKTVQRPESCFPVVPTWVSWPEIIHTRPSARLERFLLKLIDIDSTVVGSASAPTFMTFTRSYRGYIDDALMPRGPDHAFIRCFECEYSV